MEKDKRLKEEIENSLLVFGVTSLIRYIPNSIDGLKPGQRRLLFTLYQTDTGHFRKCATIIGDSVKYINTGRDAAYKSLVYMGQIDRHNHPLVISKGNYGYISDSLQAFAADRYTEGKIADFTKDFYFTEDYKFSLWKDNYTGEYREPVVLPTLLPMGLVMGSKAMAFSTANNVLPMDLKSVARSYGMYLELKKSKKKITQEDEKKITNLLTYKFPNGSKVSEKSKGLFTTGKGVVKVTGKYKIEGRKIIFNQLPYLIEAPKFVQSLMKLPTEIVNMISSVDDLSSNQGINIVITCKKDVNPNVIIEALTYMKGKNNTIEDRRVINFNYFSNFHNMVRPYSILEIYNEHSDFKLRTLGKYFEDVIQKCEEKIEYLEAILYIISDKKRLDNFFKILQKSSKETLGSNLHKTFKNIREEVLLYVTERKFTVMLKNSEDIKRQIKEIKDKLKEAQYNNKHKIDYLLKQIDEKVRKY